VEPGSALQLVVLDPTTGKYEIGAQAAELLALLDETPVAAVSIAGALREGKSFILNKLANTQGGFPVSAATRPCTHGIWMRTQEVHSNGKQHILVSLSRQPSQQTLPARS